MKTFFKPVAYYVLGFTLFAVIGFFNSPSTRVKYPNGREVYVYEEHNDVLRQIDNNEFDEDMHLNASNDGNSFRGAYSFEFKKNNYASNTTKAGMVYDRDATAAAAPITVDQKYEKIATLGAKTDSFDNDEKALKDAIKSTESLIQFEQNQGTNEHRVIQVAIGVHPDKFDVLVAEIKNIGELEVFQTDVTDKTNEFRELKAKRATLENYRNSLAELKKRSGKIEELMDLEYKILEINRQLQDLGVSLGDFDAENEFCTVKVTLREVIEDKPKVLAIEFIKRIQKGVAWAIQYYFYFTVVMLLFCLAFWLFVKGYTIFKSEKQKD